MLSGLAVVSALQTHLRSNPAALDHPVLHLDTVTCQNPCSGHGRCDEASRRCVCDRFWTENVFRRLGSEGHANCGEGADRNGVGEFDSMCAAFRFLRALGKL